MVIIKNTGELRQYLAYEGHGKRDICFVPTMGALHAGHGFLVKKAKEKQDALVVCSIFVNPTQFNEKSDFDKYPVSVEADIDLLTNMGCDVLFLPTVEEMYPGGTDKVPSYDFGYLDTILEGAQRPGHFKGVGQVVGRLLEIVKPQYLYLGQKDYQQCMVIKKLLSIISNTGVNIIICDTVREADGLAMSSRNRRLTAPQRITAAAIYQCLVSIQGKHHAARFEVVQKECIELLKDKGFEPEYVALADARDLTLLDNYQPDIPMVALIAARIGDVRLIDNKLL
ncbi:MAG: pantoate--beta-alanine ligase [Bacteroidota bacterium]